MIGAKLVCLSVTSKQAKIAPEWYHGVQGWKWRCPLTGYQRIGSLQTSQDGSDHCSGPNITPRLGTFPH